MSITGNRLREIRKTKNKTLVQVHDDLGISISGLASVERGENLCNSSTLKILADYYGVSTDYLTGKIDIYNPTSAKEQLSGIQLALYNQTEELTDEQAKEVLNYIEFVKNRDSKK